jgi:hypothetical protein
MDLTMLLGATFLSLASGLNDEQRGQALNMLSYFSERETFSPGERLILQTMVRMANDVFTKAEEREAVRDRSHLRVVSTQ